MPSTSNGLVRLTRALRPEGGSSDWDDRDALLLRLEELLDEDEELEGSLPGIAWHPLPGRPSVGDNGDEIAAGQGLGLFVPSGLFELREGRPVPRARSLGEEEA